MKKTILSAITLLAVLTMPLFASAATLSLSPTSVNVTRGQNVTMTVALNPQGSLAYTTKVELRFPANLLEVKSFSFAGSGWQALVQPGYDLTDNTNGVLIKTAGYPGGISSQVNFGTVTFLAKASGTGTVTIADVSAVYNAESQDTLTGVPVLASVKVTTPSTPAPTPLTGQVVTPTPSVSEEEQADEEEVVEEEEEVALELEPEEGTNLFATIGNILTLGTGRRTVAALVILVILAAVLYKPIRNRTLRNKEF